MVNKQKLFNWYCKVMRFFDVAPLPPLIIWEPTLACNFKCKFCGFYGPDGAKPDLQKEMDSVDQEIMWNNIFNVYRTYKPHIGIIGGEPLLKDLDPVLSLFNRKGISWSITTNGYFLGENLKYMKKYGCSEIRVSLHGPEHVHDKTVGVEGAFKKVVENINKAVRYDIPVLINCVITDDNVNHLEYMVKLAKDCGAQIRFQHLEFLTPGIKEAHKKFTEKYLGGDFPVKYGTTKLSKNNYHILDSFVVHENQDGLYEPRTLYGPDLTQYYESMVPLSLYCYQPWGTARIDPYGNVYPCIDYYFGNMQKIVFFDKIWRGETARRFRSLLKEKKLFPGCMRCCKL